MEAQRGEVVTLGSCASEASPYSILLVPPGSCGSDVNCYREALRSISPVASRLVCWGWEHLCTLIPGPGAKGGRLNTLL